MNMPLEDFFEAVAFAAGEAGYTTTEDHHPEDWAANLAPVMFAWANGYAAGYRKALNSE
jgi:hypothetical protein